jgi:hypothetical protein
MTSTALRLAVAVVILVFAWKGSVLDIQWPPPSTPAVVDNPVPVPDPALRAWAEPLRPILPKMLAGDRQYLSSLYDAMTFVVLRDGQRDDPIISTTQKFADFHSGSLRLAIDKAKVGQYPGLDRAIDQVFVSAAGADMKAIDADTRTKLSAACQVLSWAFSIKRDD